MNLKTSGEMVLEVMWPVHEVRLQPYSKLLVYSPLLPLRGLLPPRWMISKWQGGASLVHLLWHFSLVKKQKDIHSETTVVSEMTPYIPYVVHDF